MNVVKFGLPVTQPSFKLYLRNSRVKLIMSLVNTTQTVKQIYIERFEIKISNTKGKVSFYLLFLLHAVRCNCRCMPLCIPNIDCPAITFHILLIASRSTSSISSYIITIQLQCQHHTKFQSCSVDLEAKYKSHIVVFRNTHLACREMCL